MEGRLGFIRSIPIALCNALTLNPDLANPVSWQFDACLWIGDDDTLSQLRTSTGHERVSSFVFDFDFIVLQCRATDVDGLQFARTIWSGCQQCPFGQTVTGIEDIFAEARDGKRLCKSVERLSSNWFCPTERDLPMTKIQLPTLFFGRPGDTQLVGKIQVRHSRRPGSWTCLPANSSASAETPQAT